MTTQCTERAVVLGLDGVPWGLVDEWGRAGDLEHFGRLLEEGAAGSLTSTIPSSTPLAWPSIATGVWPDEHGIYSFQRVTADYSHQINTRSDIDQPTLWEMLSPAVVGNVPMTYPATEMDGKLVAGMIAPGMDEHFTAPPELRMEIEQEIPDYEISLDWNEYVGREAEIAAAIDSLLDRRRALMDLLMDTDEWNLVFFTYTEPDRLQHLIWDEDVLLDHYQQLDDILGEVLAYVEDHDATLFVVSDHGFGPIRKQIAPNSLLEREGYIVPEGSDGTRQLLESVGITKSNLRAALRRLGIDEATLVRKYLPRRFVDQVASNVPGDHHLFDLDHGETQAFSHELGNVYINDTARFDQGAVAPADVDDVKAELLSLFEGLLDPETGDQVYEVHDGDDLFPRDTFSPDIVFDPAPGYAMSRSLNGDPFITPNGTANHRKEGIFFAYGSDIEAGTRIETASVVDITPTVLHTCGRPIPENVDGRVLEEIYAVDSVAAERDIETRRYRSTHDGTRTDSDFGTVEERLQGLGYMS